LLDVFVATSLGQITGLSLVAYRKPSSPSVANKHECRMWLMASHQTIASVGTRRTLAILTRTEQIVGCGTCFQLQASVEDTSDLLKAAARVDTL